MPILRISECASLLGVSDDTVRRWIDHGKLTATHDDAGRQAVDGRQLAAFTSDNAAELDVPPTVAASARNRFRGIVTRVVKDTVMAQVEIQCGPHRVVSLMSRDSADELQLDVGSIAVASIKSTQVVVEV